MFEIKNLSVSIEGKVIIRNLSLKLKPGEIHVIMGPNGAGKSSLAEALMGHPTMKIQGRILLDGEDIAASPPDERSRKGMFLAFQNPEEIEGVRIGNLLRKARTARGNNDANLDRMVQEHENLVQTAERLGLDKSMVNREVNVGFSGGEKKRLEVVQMVSLDPKVVILDEIDSGLDVDGLKVIAKTISGLNDGTRCFLIITHYPRILKYLKTDFVHILIGGRIVRSGDAKLAHEIEEKGYGK